MINEMDASEYMESIGVPLLTSVRFYDDEKGEYINCSLMGILEDFKQKIVESKKFVGCGEHFSNWDDLVK